MTARISPKRQDEQLTLFPCKGSFFFYLQALSILIDVIQTQ